MSRPDDIPADVWEAALHAWRRTASGDTNSEVTEIAIAIMAERERCAARLDAEADGMIARLDPKDTDAELRLHAFSLKHHAAAIRKGSE